ncbi:MAG: DUF1549 domain-containing protein, partial [Verrucomicrobiota bacterium]
DRVATTGTVWMGLTTGCAQCHTHKFDPITHDDYFGLFALLNNADEPVLEVPTETSDARLEAHEERIARKEQQLISAVKEEEFRNWKADYIAKTASWTSLTPTSMESTKPNLKLEADNVVFASGDFQKRDVYTLGFDGADFSKPITAIRIEALPDKRLPARGPGAAYYEGRSGDFFLSEVILMADGEEVEFGSGNVNYGKIAIGRGKSDGSTVFDRNGSSGWSTSQAEGQRHELVLMLKKPTMLQDFSVELLFERHYVAGLGKFRISVTDEQKQIEARGGVLSEGLPTNEKDWQRLYVSTDDELEKLRASGPTPVTTLVMREWEQGQRKTFLHHRGEFLQTRHEVAPAVPAVFEQIPDYQPKDRLALAKWLVSERNPLVARVAVNRAWRSWFGG